MIYDNTAITPPPASYNNNNNDNHNRPPKNQESSSLSSSIIVIMKTAVPMLSIDQPQCFQQISAMYYKRYMPPMAMRPIASDPCRKSSSTNHAQALRWFITIPYQQLPPRPAQHFSLKFVAAHTDKPTNRRQLTLTAIMYKMHTQQEEANNNDR